MIGKSQHGNSLQKMNVDQFCHCTSNAIALFSKAESDQNPKLNDSETLLAEVMISMRP